MSKPPKFISRRSRWDTHVMEKNLDAVLSPLDILEKEKQEYDVLSK